MPTGVYERKRSAHRFVRPAGVSATEGIPDPGARALEMIHPEALRGWQPEDLTARGKLMENARSTNPQVSYQAQRTLCLDFDLTLPLLASRLPRDLRDRLTNLRPLGPVQPARCLSCGGELRDGKCEGRYIQTQEQGHGVRWRRCRAVWR